MEFSISDLTKITGVKRVTLRQWIHRGFLELSIAPQGSGRKNRYKIEDIYRICVLEKLLRGGVARLSAGYLIGHIQFEKLRKGPNYYILQVGPEGNWKSALGVMMDHIPQPSDEDYFFVVVNLNAIKQEVDEKVKDLLL